MGKVLARAAESSVLAMAAACEACGKKVRGAWWIWYNWGRREVGQWDL
jgi:hypothetical protein